MTNKEKLEKAYELIDKANKLIDEVANSEPEIEPEDPVAKYINAINEAAHVIDGLDCVNLYGESHSCFSDEFDASRYNPYYQFLSRKYADEASRMYKLICMQLAFKWCHDREYVPDWTDPNEFKWHINYNTKLHCYSTSYICSLKGCAEVYFSSKEIAQKCADWLNSQLGGE